MIKLFVNRPLFTTAIFFIILLIGFFCLRNLPLDFLPNIEIPTLTIITPYPGASAEDIEISVTKVIEDSVATVPNIDKITSDSSENISIVTIAFKWGANLDSASADVRDKMDAIRAKLPDDIQPPTILKFDLSQIPVLILGISAGQSYDKLFNLADKKISPALKKIQGVGTVSIRGGLVRQINVDIDRHRIEAYHLSLLQVNSALQGANLSIPAGSIKSQNLEYGVRIPGEYKNISEILNTIVGNFSGRDIFLSDIAEVTDSFKDEDSVTEVDGKPGIMLMIQKQSGANTVKVVEETQKELNKIKEELPPDLEITVIQDTAEVIKRQINELQTTLYWSFLFVILTVLFFLRNMRGSFIISLAIPFSLIAAFIYLYISGASINIISLASIIIAVGVVVDDAIVILENIYRHKDKKGEQAKEAAMYGAIEVSSAVIASTTTNMVIFFPMLVVGGFIGIFFRELSLTIIVVMGMSLVTALSLVPMLSSKFLSINKKEKLKRHFLENFIDKSEGIFEYFETQYKKALEWALTKRKMVLISCALIFVFSMFLFPVVGTEFFPEQDTGSFSANVFMPPGTRMELTAKAMREIEKKVKEQIPELQYILVTAGSGSQLGLSAKSGANFGNLFVKVVPLSERTRTLKELERVVANIALSVPGLKSVDFNASGANQMTGGGKPVSVELYGADFDVIDKFADELKLKIEKIPGVVDPSLSREKANPEYAVNVDREKAADLGLSLAEIGIIARGNIYGTVVSKFREGGDEYDIFTRLKAEDRKTLDDIKNTMITTRTGKNITLGNIAKIEEKNGPQVIQRKNQQRLVMVEADYFGRPLGDIISDVRAIISKMTVPSDLSVKIGGNAEQMQESFSSLFMAFFLGIALLYLVMVAQFESFLDPLIIMFAIPFAVIGVVWGLFFAGVPFGVMPFVGLIMVAGIAVKNSIVLVDYINILRARGIEIKEAIAEAGRTRLRPILMTSSTTVLGLLPILLNNGEGSGFWKPLAISVMGGLTVSATISLIFVPTLYFVLESFLLKNKGREIR